ncbi:MAG: beta-eliminating lyase-related protein [Albidovulum sp.]|nr:beta-eliminating lyase-related protein [Albidovulum sp.]
MNFASDNAGPAAPEAVDALAKANAGYAGSYGSDALMEAVAGRFREVFEAPSAAVYLVATGTAANSLSLACLSQPWSAIYCHRHSHVEEDECGGPEFFTGGAKLVLLDGAHAKIDPANLESAIEATALVGVHNVQKGPLSITNATENGAVYTCAETAELASIAKRHGLPCHMDGARFANAVVRLECKPADLSWKAGIDILSFGGTKNGLVGVEAVVIFDDERAWEFELRRKRSGHLLSKHRFLSAQMNAYLEGDLWLKLAERANLAADRLANALGSISGIRLLHPVDANMVFASWPRKLHRIAAREGAKYYLWPFSQCIEGDGDESLSARLVCNWSTTDREIDRFADILAGG